MTSLTINKLCIIGVGSIGGSLACALRAAGVVKHIVGYGRDATHLAEAKSLNVIDEACSDLKLAVQEADIIVLATPLGVMGELLTSIKPYLSSTTIITDVGSAKQHVIHAVQQAFGEVPHRFVAGHPIAGTERSGVQACKADLFKQRRVILTPEKHTDSDALKLITQMWQACGAEVTEMNPEHHDEVLAATSHLPHMLAYALVDTLARMQDQQEIFEYAAGGFRDFTRIASSDPKMWHDICVANREQLVKMLHAFNEDLQRLTKAVEQADSKYLQQTFTRAKKARDEFCR